MKKRLIVLISLLVVLIVLHLLSDFFVKQGSLWLKNRIITALPEGSSIEYLDWDILTEVSMDSVNVSGVGYADRVILYYSPLDLLRRRVKRISIFNSNIEIMRGDSMEEGGGGLPPAFYIEDLSVYGGTFKWDEYAIQINGKSSVFSTGNELFVNVDRGWGNLRGKPFGIKNIEFKVKQDSLKVQIDEIDAGRSVLELSGSRPGEIHGNGRVYLSDLREFYPVRGSGFVDFNFNFDSNLTFQGYSHVDKIEDFNIPQFTFSGKEDSIRIRGDNIDGFLKINEGVKAGFNLANVNLKNFHSDFPETDLTGNVIFDFKDKSNYNLETDLEGNVFGEDLKKCSIDYARIGREIEIRRADILFNGGEIFCSGCFTEKFSGNLRISDFRVNSITEFWDFPFKGVLNADISVEDEIYGAFSIGDFSYSDFLKADIQGNLKIIQDNGKFPGDISFVTREVEIKERSIFRLGEGNLKIQDGNYCIDGFFKSNDRELTYDLEYGGDSLLIKNLVLNYRRGILRMQSPCAVQIEPGIKFRDLRFSGDRENFFSLSIEITGEEIEGRGNYSKFDPSMLDDFGIIDLPVSGAFSGEVIIGGNKSNPVYDVRGSGGFEWKGKMVADSIGYRLSYRSDFITFDRLRVYDGKSFSLFSGNINIVDREMNMNVRLNNAGEWVFYPVYEQLDPRYVKINGELTVGGKFNKPLVYGSINFKDNGLVVREPGIAIKELTGKVDFEGREGSFSEITATLGEGKVTSSGQFRLDEKSFDIDINLKNTPLNWQYINSLTDGRISVKKEKERIEIGGYIDLKRATVTVGFTQRKGNGRKPENLYVDLTFDATDGNVWIRNDMTDMELTGEVGVNYRGGPLLLSGDLSVKQGNFYYLSRSFDIMQGNFQFKDSPELNPSMNVKAKTLVQGSDTVFLVVTGEMRNPNFDLYSKPPMSKANIITLLSLNLSWEDFSSMESIERSLTETAFNYWVRQTFSRRFKEKFGIDILQMRGTGSGYEFILGKYITDRLFVKARTDLQSYGLSEIRAEYKLKKWASMTAEKDFSGKTRFLLNLRWRY